MIDDADPEDLARAHETLGDFVVLPAGLGIAARVVVNDQDRRGRLSQRRREHLARVHQALVQAAATHFDLADQTVAAVEQEHDEHLLAVAAHARTEVRGDLLGGVELLAGATGVRRRRAPSSNAARNEPIFAGPSPGTARSSAVPARASASSEPKRSSSACAWRSTPPPRAPVRSTSARSSASASDSVLRAPALPRSSVRSTSLAV